MRTFLAAIVIFFIVQIEILWSLTPNEVCEFCQHTQKTVYGHFGGRIPSKRVLHRQLKHECKRLPKYKRRCLMTVGPNIAQIFADMTNDSDSFKPLKLCEVLKECGKNQSPLVTALETDDNVFNESLPEAETETTVFSIHLITPLPQS